MHDFKVGDRVVCIRGDECSIVLVGDTGTVCKICNNGTIFRNIVSVRWDRYDPRKHSCSGGCEVGRGWDVSASRIKHTDTLLNDELDIGDPDLLMEIVCMI